MKYLFFIQNEGRGHLTQALTLAEKLRAEGHEIAGAVLNENPYRKLPDFFINGIACPLHFINSPYFLKNPSNTGINLTKSIFFNIFRFSKYFKSLRTVRALCKQINPDIIINFYEPIVGLYYFFLRPKIACYCLGHQFFLDHPTFQRPKGHKIDHFLLLIYGKLISFGAKYKIALSFTNEKDALAKKLLVCPPLIRKEIKYLKPENHSFILSYLLNDGYCQQIINWSKENPQQIIEAFWDKNNEVIAHKFEQNLTFHPISGQLFLDFLKDCSSYVSTAGFESICEAAYLQKNILMIPTINHYEQLCNAIDAKRAGLAESDNYFNIDLILNKKANSENTKLAFKNWVDNYDQKIIKIITNKL